MAMSEVEVIEARHLDGTIEECSIEISQGPAWKLVFSGAGLQGKHLP